MSASPLDERRQRAGEAFWDAIVDAGAREAAEVAIETATRVQITDEAVSRVFAEIRAGATARAVVHIALEELGFEVEQ